MVCRSCGNSLKADARFCGRCGVSFGAPASVSASAVGHVAAAQGVTRTAAAPSGQLGRYQWMWPDVGTPESARYAVRQAFWGAIFVCGVTTLFAFIAMSASDPRLPVGPSALVDAAIFAMIAFGIWKESRVAAIAGLGVYVLEQLYMLSAPGQWGVGRFFVIVALICAFIGGIRGTFALHEFRSRGEI